MCVDHEHVLQAYQGWSTIIGDYAHSAMHILRTCTQPAGVESVRCWTEQHKSDKPVYVICPRGGDSDFIYLPATLLRANHQAS